MKSYNEHQRRANIVKRAVDLGLEIGESIKWSTLVEYCAEFLIENTEHKEEHCPLKHENGDQRIDWSDGIGYEYWSQGELVQLDPLSRGDKKVIYDTVVNSEGIVIDLYCYA